MVAKKSDDISFESLESSICQKLFKPLYYFYGDEDYLADEIIRQIITNALDESTKTFNLDILDCNTVCAKDVVSVASSYPMMSERRVVVARDIHKLLAAESSREIMQRYFQQPSQTTILLMVGNKPDARTSIIKSIKDNGTVVEFKRFYDNQIPPWIKKDIEIFGKNITSEAAELLAQYVGSSLREIHSELEKLSIYIGDKTTVQEEDINNLIGISKTYNIFSLQREIGEKDLAKSMVILENMLDNGESLLGIIVMLTKYFQKLWVLKGSQFNSDSDIASVLGVNTFFVKEYRVAATNFKLSEIEDNFITLAETDETLKTSIQDERLAATLLLFRLVKKSQIQVNH
jgi:DNA polymerase III subunit delta